MATVSEKAKVMSKHTLVLSILLVVLLGACTSKTPTPLPPAAQEYSETREESFAVGDAPTLTVDHYGGNVTVRAGEGGTIRVVAIKRAAREGDLEPIEIEMTERDSGLEIKTDRPFLQNVSHELEFTVPAGTRLDLHTGEGNIEISGASGEIDAYTGGGVIGYRGTPQGSCRFETGAGDIKLRLPATVNVRVDLQTTLGSIGLDWSILGQASKQKVSGTIGSGAEAEIVARTGSGNIDLISQ